MNEPIEFGGWRIAPDFVAAEGSADFYAVYTGDVFGNAARGIAAIIARAHPLESDALPGAREAAQLAVHSFAEGYFGAAKTLSPGRAAAVSLHSINNWLFSQLRSDMSRHLAPVSLTALLFHGPDVGIVHLGVCRLYRRRGGAIAPLNRPHWRGPAQRKTLPARAIGLDLDLSVDYTQERAEAGDEYLLAGSLQSETSEALQASFNTERADAGALMKLIVEACPAPDAEQAAQELASLPLRPAPREGDVWDGFTIGKTIYHGRYTLLKRVYDSINECDVAMKIPLPSMLQDKVFAAGFMREAWIGSTVRGNKVVRYLELSPERRSSLYLIMPIYEGETLETRLRRGPHITLPDGIGIALQLCEAVQDLAALQIVHRDIKPENIMLLKNNEIRLLDLGLAYLPGIDLQDAEKPGGTIRYMAPEILKGVQANARTEIYALGITIYRMFSGGAYPFGQREAVPLSRLRPDLPSWLGHILAKTLAEDPAARYEDAGALEIALNQGLISGAGDAPRRQGFPTKLHVWQAAAVVFGIGFFLMLLRAL